MSEKEFKIGNCFKCGRDLKGAVTRGLVNNIPVYVDCPYCRAVNSYRKRCLEWLEKVSK